MNLYNAERKQKFMEDYPTYHNYPDYVLTIFVKSAQYERRFDTDICNMNPQQLQLVFDNVGGLMVKYQRSIRTVLDSYVQWCIVNGYCKRNIISKIFTVSTDKVRRSMVANPIHLKTTLDVVYGDAEEYTVQYIYRTIFWLAFMGFGWSDLLALASDEVDFTAMQVSHTRPDHTHIWGDIPAEAVPDILQACELTTLTYDKGRFIQELQRADGDKIVRLASRAGVRTEEEQSQYIKHSVRPSISRAFQNARRCLETTSGVPKWCSIDLTYDNTFRSGIFYRHYERERAGLEVNIGNIYQLRYSGNIQNKSDFSSFKYLYQQNYAQWKEAFT